MHARIVKRYLSLLFALLLPCSGLLRASDYVVLVSETTAKDAAWNEVGKVLSKKHGDAPIIEFKTADVGTLAERLKAERPRFACVVARHEEADRRFVTQLHQVFRALDDDPYADCFWAILTGFDAKNAMAIARTNDPLTVERVASGTEVALEKCKEGIWYCELNKNKVVEKQQGNEAVVGKCPTDTTKLLVESLNDYAPGLFVTSGHATERDWQIGFRYKNGTFRSEKGQLYGLDTAGQRFDIQSPNPKVYLPIGNCLMGHIDGPDAMALAWLKSAGVQQMIGYTVPTWYGYAGWGMLDYFVEQPGRYTFTEAFFANQHALIHRLENCFPEVARAEVGSAGQLNAMRSKIKPSAEATKLGLRAQDGLGLLFDRDAVAFYGDPAWQAKMASGECAYAQELTHKDGVYTFDITPNIGAKSFDPVNTNGSQRGWRPIVGFFPKRLKDIEVVEGADLKPVIADDFILVPNPRKCDPERKYRVVFRASEAK